MLRRPRPSKRGTTRRPPTANCLGRFITYYMSTTVSTIRPVSTSSVRSVSSSAACTPERRISLRRIAVRAAAAAAVAVILLAGGVTTVSLFQTPCAAPDRHHPSGRTFAGGAARRHQGLAQLRRAASSTSLRSFRANAA